MFKYDDGQISIYEFGQPMGMSLREDNRWVQKSMTIPWSKIERRYAELFESETGNVAKPLRLGLGACLIQGEYGYADIELTLQIQESPYLQYFCGYKAYDDSKPPFDPSLMVHFRKRLTPEILGEINELIISSHEDDKPSDDHKDDDNENNSGTMIVDATCAPAQIKYPQDTALPERAPKPSSTLCTSLEQKSPALTASEHTRNIWHSLECVSPGRRKFARS